MTGLLNGLKTGDFIERVADPRDRRRIGVHLTPEGRQVLEKLLPHYYRNMARLTAGLSENERQTIRSGLVEFRLDVPDGMRILVDPDQLYRVLSNLIRNAAQAIERNLLSDQEVAALVDAVRQQLSSLQVDAMRLTPAHVLVAVNERKEGLENDKGVPETCLCNFQHLSWPTE